MVQSLRDEKLPNIRVVRSTKEASAFWELSHVGDPASSKEEYALQQKAFRCCKNAGAARSHLLRGSMMNLILIAALQTPVQPPLNAMELPLASVSTEEAVGHLIDEQPVIRLKNAPHNFFLGGILLDVIVGKTGEVLWAVAVPDTYEKKIPAETVNEAESAVHRLRFNPFRSHGLSVPARFQWYVMVLPPELKPSRHVPVPEVRNWRSVKISLKRVGCFGTCPAYQVVIRGDGSVFYVGRAYVDVIGQKSGSITKEKIAELITIFRQADFFSMNRTYGGCGTDAPDVFVSVEIEGRVKEVADCMGEWYGMPHSVLQVEQAIDRVSGAENWIKPNPGINLPGFLR